MTNQEEIIERIRYLIRQQHLTQVKFAELIGLDAANLSKHLSGKLPVTKGLVNRIVADLGVSKHWLVNGEGVPFARPTHSMEFNSTEVGAGYSNTPVPVYDIDVTAGCVELSKMFTQEHVIGSISLPNIGRGCAIVKVSGDSMRPLIKDGGYIAIRQINDASNIFWGQMYVIVMEEYRMVKFLRRHPDDNKVILRSANPDYDDMEVDRSEISKLYLVEAVLNFDIRC